jgi:hypothetical protein
MQLALGSMLTIATIWLVPFVRDHLGWWAALALLAPGPRSARWHWPDWIAQRLRRPSADRDLRLCAAKPGGRHD